MLLYWDSLSIGNCLKPSSLRFQLQKIALIFIGFNLTSGPARFISSGLGEIASDILSLSPVPLDEMQYKTQNGDK